MTLPASVDVLVVGYGPVGAALACMLGRHGVSTLVIDKQHEIWMAPRAIALDHEALRILQLAGLDDDAFARTPIPQVRMISPQIGFFGRLDTSGTTDCHPKLVTFYQPDLERALRATVATLPSVQIATGLELESFTDTDRVHAIVIDEAGVRHSIGARFLVGADGASSKVRTGIGEDFLGETYAEDWLIVDTQGTHGEFDHVEFICDYKRPTPHMIAPGGRTRWEFMMQPGEIRAEMESDDTIRRLLAPWPGSSELAIERKAVYRFHARSCAHFSKGHVFLVGDAAHVTPPFAGQGLVAGLRDAANLSWKLAWVTRGHARESILETYDEERRPHAVKMINFAKLMGSLIMPRSIVVAVLVHSLMKLLRVIPPIRKNLEGNGAKPTPAFATGLFVKRRGRVRPGDWLPQFEMGTKRSDDVLGSGFSVVSFGEPITLDPATRTRWSAFGGAVVETAPDAYERANGWCAVVRPDRTILHAGRVRDAERVIAEALQLMSS